MDAIPNDRHSSLLDIAPLHAAAELTNHSLPRFTVGIAAQHQMGEFVGQRRPIQVLERSQTYPASITLLTPVGMGQVTAHSGAGDAPDKRNPAQSSMPEQLID